MILVRYGDPEDPESLLSALLPQLYSGAEETLHYVLHPRGGHACLVRYDGIVEWVPRGSVLSIYVWVERTGPPIHPRLN